MPLLMKHSIQRKKLMIANDTDTNHASHAHERLQLLKIAENGGLIWSGALSDSAKSE